jgi:hypothetical protein
LGAAALRSIPATPMPRTVPPLICEMAVGIDEQTRSTWLPSAAFTAGNPPLNGMCVASSLASSRNRYSVATCVVVPVPADPNVIDSAFAIGDELRQCPRRIARVHNEHVRKRQRRLLP